MPKSTRRISVSKVATGTWRVSSINRSAKTGRFIISHNAARYPLTTVAEPDPAKSAR